MGCCTSVEAAPNRPTAVPPPPPEPEPEPVVVEVVVESELIPRAGVTLGDLEEFISWCGGEEVLEGKTVQEVADDIILAWTSELKSSYCGFLVDLRSADVSHAQVFVSYARRYVFLDVMNSLRDHFNENENIVLWIDIFSMNLHEPIIADELWIGESYKPGFLNIQHTILILSSDPIPLQRTWCLFEIYYSIQSGNKFEISMTYDEIQELLHTMSEETLLIDILYSDSSIDDEMDTLVKFFDKEEGGIINVNYIIQDYFNKWIENMKSLHIIEEVIVEEDVIIEEPVVEPIVVVSDGVDEFLGEQMLIAYEYIRIGKWNSAEDIYHICLEKRINKYGPEHTSTLMNFNCLGDVFYYQRKFIDAEPLYQTCYEMAETALGKLHEDSLRYLNNLGQVKESQGKWLEAQQLYEQCIEGRKVTLGEEHKDTLLSRLNLADKHVKTGQYISAEETYLDCLRILESTLGSTHLDTILARNKLGVFYQVQKKYKKAESYLLLNYDLCLTTYQEDHNMTLQCGSYLAQIYIALCKFSLAENLLNQLLTVLRGKVHIPEQHPQFLHVQQVLALCYQMQMKFTESEQLYTSIMKTRETILGIDHGDTLCTMAALADLYKTRGMKPKATLTYAKCLQLREAKYSTENLETLHIMDKLGELYELQGRLVDAESMFKVTLPLREKIQGKTHRDTLNSLNHLAFIYKSQMRYEEAKPLYIRCFEVSKERLSENHPITVALLWNVNTLGVDSVTTDVNNGEDRDREDKNDATNQSMDDEESGKYNDSINEDGNNHHATISVQ